MERRLIDINKRTLISLINDECVECIKKNATQGYANITCPIDKKKCRVGLIEGKLGRCYAMSKDSKTTANFKTELNNSYQAIPQLVRLFDSVRRNVASLETKRVNHVVHNLKNLHAQSIQELSLFVPQDKFTYNVNSTLDSVMKSIKKNIKTAALTFLRLVKINNGIKAELSIYDKLIKNDGINPALSIKSYSLMDVIFLVSQPFFEDFHEKKVYFQLDHFYKRADFDFETIFSALYHIIGNATKYVEPNTEVNVKFSEDDKYCIAKFSMSSYYLYPEDIEHMFEEGYSGKLAQLYEEAGQGLGMYRAKLFVKWNKGELLAESDGKMRKVKNKEYSMNTIVLKLPKSQ